MKAFVILGLGFVGMVAYVMITSEPEHITVQHILISFKGKTGKATRSQDEAKALAEKVLGMVKADDSFDDLVKKYTDDSAPGIYKMANKDVTPAQGESARSGMVAAFGNVGFTLGVGDVGMAPYHEKDSPFGWHIIKRLK